MPDKYLNPDMPKCASLVETTVPFLNPMKYVQLVSFSKTENTQRGLVDAIQTPPDWPSDFARAHSWNTQNCLACTF